MFQFLLNSLHFLTTYFNVAVSPCFWSFTNIFLRFEPQNKAALWITIYSFSQFAYSSIPNLSWLTVESPICKTEYTILLIYGVIFELWTFIMLYLHKNIEREHAQEKEFILYDSSKPNEEGKIPVFVETSLGQREDEYY